MKHILFDMVGKSKINIFNKINKQELDSEISKYTTPHRIYERLIAMRLLSEGRSMTEVASTLNKSYQTISRWAKLCEQKGLDGLIPKFGGGRPSKLTFSEFKELDEMIEENPNMRIKDVTQLIYTKFNVLYSDKQVGEIVDKLGYNYSKAYPILSKEPVDSEEQLKKKPRNK